MSDEGDGKGGKPPAEPSYDPRTWMKTPDLSKAGSDRTAPQTPPPDPSFDPKTWLPEAKRPAAPPPPPPPKPAPARRALVFGAAGLAVAAAGSAGLWALTRRRPGAPPARGPATPMAASAKTSPFPTVVTAARGDGSQVALDADSLQHLKIQLRYTCGLSDTEAGSAAGAVDDALGGEQGKLHVLVVMAARSGGDDQIVRLIARREDGSGVRLDRVESGFLATRVSQALNVRTCGSRLGTMNDQSFYSSATSVFHDDLLIAQFVAAMAYDFNFAHEVAPGSKFQGVYEEQRDADGNRVGAPRLKMAYLQAQAIDDRVDFNGATRERHAAAKTRKLYQFDAARDGHIAWYDEFGRSAVRGLMRTPVEGARVTSKFGPRIHPIFETVKIHAGVDFGCAIGTPVFAAADGVVLLARPVQGYGNYLRIAHGPHMWTAYGHLSAYPASTVEGAKVSQGQVVAFTGNTGNSTGPHLHYEIRIDGEPVDPLTFETTQSVALAGDQMDAFRRERDRLNKAVAACA